MYVQSNMDGLGKFKLKKLKKLFKKLAMTAAPPHVRMKEIKKAKVRKARAAVYATAPAAEATPAPQVEPTYYQEPLPQPAPQSQAPQYYPRPMPATYPVQYEQPRYAEPQYSPELSPSTYPSAMPSGGGFPQWYPPETGIEEADDSVPVVPAYEFEARGDDEYDYLEGLSAGGYWADLFKGAASEALARSKQKRAQRKIDAQSRQYSGGTDYGAPYNLGFDMMSLLPIAAVGLGAFLLLRKKR